MKPTALQNNDNKCCINILGQQEQIKIVYNFQQNLPLLNG